VDVESIVEQLREEIRRIENAINALLGLGSVPAGRRGPGRPAGSKNAIPKKRTMSAAARKRVSAAMKARWANWKGKSAPQKAKPAAKKAAPKRKTMSPAARKKLSALMKARWAAKNKVA